MQYNAPHQLGLNGRQWNEIGESIEHFSSATQNSRVCRNTLLEALSFESQGPYVQR